MPRADKIDSLLDHFRLDAIEFLREKSARVERVERDHRVEGHPQFRRVAADHRGQPSQDSIFFRLRLALEHHQPVVQLDCPHRLDEQRLARHAAILHDSLESFRVVQLHRQHETAIANRDQVVGDERLHARGVERAQESRDVARPDDKIANFYQRFATEDRADSRRGQDIRPLIDKFAYWNRARMRSELDHLGGRAQSLADFRGISRGLNRGGRFAPRLRGTKIHDEVNHLVEFE